MIDGRTPTVRVSRTGLLGVALVLLVATSALAPAAGAIFTTEPARLSVEQPHYIGEPVEVESPPPNASSNVSTYVAEGAVLDIQPTNFNADEVTDFGVSGPASLSYDDQMGTYELRAEESGTYEVFWLVRENREVGNESRVVTVRYEARIQVNVTDRTHMAVAGLESLKDDAASWRNLVETIQSEDVAGPNADVEAELDAAIAALRVLNGHVLEVLTGRLSAQLLALFITLPGLIILGGFALMHYLSRRFDVRELRERRHRDETRADLDEQLSKAEAYERRAALEAVDWNDIFPDDVARRMRDSLGDTPLDGWLRLSSELSPRNLVRDRLRALEDTHVAVERGSAVPDGGLEDPAEPVEGVEYRLVPTEDVDDAEMFDSDVYAVDPSNDDLVDGLAWDDPELRDVDLADAVADPEDVARLDAPDLEELVDEYGTGEVGKEEYGEYLAEFVGLVVDHDLTDREGRVRPPRLMLNLYLRLLRYLGDAEDVPLPAYQADHVEALLTSYDHEAEVREQINRTLREGV